MRPSVIVLLALALISPLAPNAAATSFNLTRVVDLNTPIPNGTGSFTVLNSLALSGGKLAFPGGGSSGQQGLYLFDGVGLSRVADLNTPIPNGTGNFTTVSSAQLSGNNVLTVGLGAGQHGLYLFDGAPLGAVADLSTPIPNGAGTFTGFFDLLLDGGDVVFRGVGGGQNGEYLYTPSGLSRVADLSTSIPNGTGTFDDFSLSALSGGHVAFIGSGSGQQGVYLYNGSTLSRVADLTTAIPNGTGTFTGFAGASLLMSGSHLMFFAVGNSGQQGLYLFDGATLSRVADASTAIPGGTGSFTNFVTPALSGGTVAFIGQGASSQSGIYLFDGSTLSRVVDKITAIPNGTGSFTAFLGMALSGGSVAFYGQGVSSQQGIYLFDGASISAVADLTTAIPNGTGNFSGFAFTPALDGQHLAFAGFGVSSVGYYLASIGGTTTTTLPAGSTTTTVPTTSTTTTTLPDACQDQSGIAGLQCLCRQGLPSACSADRLPIPIKHGFVLGCAKVDKLAAATVPKKIKSLARKTAARFDKLDHIGNTKRTAGKLSAPCETALRSTLDDARTRADALRATH